MSRASLRPRAVGRAGPRKPRHCPCGRLEGRALFKPLSVALMEAHGSSGSTPRDLPHCMQREILCEIMLRITFNFGRPT